MLNMSKFTLTIALLCLCSCATGASVQNVQTIQEPPLSKTFDTIVFSDFEIPPQITTDYPQAATECMSSAISKLMMKNKYKKVEKNNGSLNDASTLLVKTKISDMRIVSSAARMWGGALAGSSYMNMEVKFIDTATGNVLKKKDLSSRNNAFAAAWSFGSSDSSLPTDMGGILAEYIANTVPAM